MGTKGSQSWQDVASMLHKLVQIDNRAAAAVGLLPEEHLQLPHLIKRPHICATQQVYRIKPHSIPIPKFGTLSDTEFTLLTELVVLVR
jgi:hypothetical protein